LKIGRPTIGAHYVMSGMRIRKARASSKINSATITNVQGFAVVIALRKALRVQSINALFAM